MLGLGIALPTVVFAIVDGVLLKPVCIVMRYRNHSSMASARADPVVWSIAASTLIVVALLGTLVPSLFAAHLNPIEALRTEWVSGTATVNTRRSNPQVAATASHNRSFLDA